MLRLLVTFWAFFICIYAQEMDLTHCDPSKLKPDTVTEDIPLALQDPEKSIYQMNAEVNDESKKTTIELEQYYHGPANTGLTITRYSGLELKIYVYGDTNERLTVIESINVCTVEKANDSFTQPISSVNINGKEHIYPPLALMHLVNKDMKEVYAGKTTVRGISARRWLACTFDQQTKATNKLTIDFTDPDEWQIAYPVPNQKTVPLQMKVESKLPNGTYITSDFIITNFRAGNFAEQELWVPGTGVYCPDRAKGKPLPKVPAAFTFRSEIVTPTAGSDNVFGTTTAIREVFDTKNKLFRYDYVEGTSPITEVHDFSTGIRYKYDRFKGNCSLSVIDPGGVDSKFEGKYVKMRDPMEFFNFDSPTFQYVGQKRARGINCDVWIGTKLMTINGTTISTTWEWYFMATGWFEQADTQVEAAEPALLIVTAITLGENSKFNRTEYIKSPIYYHFSDFDESGLDSFEFDIIKCVNNYPKRRFMFNLPNTYRNYMEQYQSNLKLGALLGIVSSIAVFPIRVAELQLEFNENDVSILFTVLEKAPFYGDVDPKPKEISLADAVALLNATISAGKMIVPFIIDDTTFFSLVADSTSLKEIESRKGGPIYILKETIKTNGYSTEKLTGIAVGVLIVGIIIGIIAGVFFCIFKPNTLPLDKVDAILQFKGFHNPGYKRQTDTTA